MIQVNNSQLKVIAPEWNGATPDELVSAVNTTLTEFRINTGYRVAAFLAHVAVESAGFNRFRENLNYSTVSRLMQVFPTRFLTEADTLPYLHNPQALANFVYANRLGNGSVQSGDGWRFRGGGLIQTTGRFNYGLTGVVIGVPLGDTPALIEKPLVAARAAGYYWASKGLNELADAIPGVPEDQDFLKETKIINGGTTGLADRKIRYKRGLPLFI